MLHLSIAIFALLLVIGGYILTRDYLRYSKFEHDLKAHKGDWDKLVRHEV